MLPSARRAAVHSLIPAVRRFPDLPLVEPDLGGLSGPDAALAVAIHRTTLQRWLTLDHLIARHLKSPLRRLDETTHAVLLTAAAQLVFFDRLPAYAVIDQSVQLAKSLGNPRAAGLVNAVSRKLADLVAERSDEPWAPAVDRLPTAEGRTLRLSAALLPKPDNLLAHLVVATSHPLPLLQRWFKQHGREVATRLALHSLQNPPTYVVDAESARPWDATREELADWLAADPRRRVQDPASLASVAAAADLRPPPATVLDLCAGRGTKTRQLRAVFPDARITAHDPDDARRADLQNVPGITVAEPGPQQQFDLVLLDVPCSNTGVLARRPGARYRATADNLDSLNQLQRQIVDRGLAHIAPGGRLLYCTCSVEREENAGMLDYILQRIPAAEVLTQRTVLPSTAAAPVADEATKPIVSDPAGGYHDGSYHALVMLPR